MKIKVKKSYTYKEVCKIRDKAMEYAFKEYKKYIRDHNKDMLAFNKAWSDRQTRKDKEYYEYE